MAGAEEQAKSLTQFSLPQGLVSPLPLQTSGAIATALEPGLKVPSVHAPPLAQAEQPLVGLPAGSNAQVWQQTLASPVQRSGVGLHQGLPATVRILPAAAQTGRYFVRVDLPDVPRIPAELAAVNPTRLSTELRVGKGAVRTVEHLLAALAGLGIDNARIEIDGPEVPLLDGSAQPWVEAITAAGIVLQDAERPQWQLSQPLWLQQEDAFVAALPAPALRFTYGIDFALPAIGNQWYSWAPSLESFAAAVAPARTFGLAHQVEALRQQGLIQGGSLDNALVCDETGWLNPPLRFSNEPVRHKLLDLVGDLSLLGNLPCAHFLAYKASHELHARLAQLLNQVRSSA